MSQPPPGDRPAGPPDPASHPGEPPEPEESRKLLPWLAGAGVLLLAGLGILLAILLSVDGGDDGGDEDGDGDAAPQATALIASAMPQTSGTAAPAPRTGNGQLHILGLQGFTTGTYDGAQRQADSGTDMAAFTLEPDDGGPFLLLVT